MAPGLLTLNDLEGHFPRSFPKVISRLQAFSSAIRRTFMQHFTRFQLTARSLASCITTRRFASAVYATDLCLSVCVGLSQVGVLLKRLTGLS